MSAVHKDALLEQLFGPANLRIALHGIHELADPDRVLGYEELIGEIGRMTAAQLDELPFGAIQLDNHGRVLSYNRAEERLSGRRREVVVGRDFFAEVAPCTRVKRFFGAFQLGVERRSLNEVFDFVFHFPEGKREVRIRMIYSEMPKPAVWIFVTPV